MLIVLIKIIRTNSETMLHFIFVPDVSKSKRRNVRGSIALKRMAWPDRPRENVLAVLPARGRLKWPTWKSPFWRRRLIFSISPRLPAIIRGADRANRFLSSLTRKSISTAPILGLHKLFSCLCSPLVRCANAARLFTWFFNWGFCASRTFE